MVFNSLTFAVFFSVVLLLNALPVRWTVRKLNLLVASYLFYAAWNPPFVVLLWISTVVDWYVARWLAGTRPRGRRRAVLAVSLAVNLSLLGYFKYGAFVLEQFVASLHLLGVAYRPPAPDIFLPIGISFYTFQTLSYTIDVYRRHIAPWPSFRDFALYVSFFPQLVAGPIVRAADFLPQCPKPRRATRPQLAWGLSLLTLGVFEKVVLADAVLAPVADAVYGSADRAGFGTGWLGAISFSGQIFFDFTGYSNCAIGAALCLGFKLRENFRFPYASIGFADYWRRWHISLSTWLRDYLYVSLGGGAKGAGRAELNLALTMLLGGLWHGAAWTFVVWGALHGAFLAIERRVIRLWGRRRLIGGDVTRFGIALGTFLAMGITFAFFRAPDFSTAFDLVTAMLGGGPDALSVGVRNTLLATSVVLAMFLTHWWMRDTTLEAVARRVPWWLRSLVLAGLLVAIFLAPGDNRAFIYFQF